MGEEGLFFQKKFSNALIFLTSMIDIHDIPFLSTCIYENSVIMDDFYQLPYFVNLRLLSTWVHRDLSLMIPERIEASFSIKNNDFERNRPGKKKSASSFSPTRIFFSIFQCNYFPSKKFLRKENIQFSSLRFFPFLKLPMMRRLYCRAVSTLINTNVWASTQLGIQRCWV